MTTSSIGTGSAEAGTDGHGTFGLLAPGDVLGRYEVLFPLATGGMASVYAARLVGDGGFQKAVALKVMLPHLARDERFVAMFTDEAALAARVQSPHVVQVMELGREGEHLLFIAMELVVGVSLHQVFAHMTQPGASLPLPGLCTILAQAASGLQDAHDARAPSGQRLGIVHRDISPHNVLVGVDGRARITDFGIAHAIERIGATQAGEPKGKLPYFSPEQVRCSELDGRSDVFSLGIVAWELLAGQRLFDAPNPLATAQAVAAKPIPRLDLVRSGVPRAVADAVAHALERDPARRLASADAFARELRAASEATTGLAEGAEVGAAVRALCGRDIIAIEQGLVEALATPTAGHRALPAHPLDGRPRPVVIAALTVLCCGMLAGVLWGAQRALLDPVSAAPTQVVVDAEPGPPLPETTRVEPSTSVEPARPVRDIEASPKVPARPKPRHTRRLVRSATQPSGATTRSAARREGRDTLLRNLEDFDRERRR